jgi:hypothetical protein
MSYTKRKRKRKNKMKTSTKMKWNKLISMNKKAVSAFANGDMPKNTFYSLFTNTEVGGMVRNYIREKGTDKARNLAKQALRRAS